MDLEKASMSCNPLLSAYASFSARVIEMEEWRGRVDISDCMAVHKPSLLGLLEHNLDLFKFKPGGAVGVCH